MKFELQRPPHPPNPNYKITGCPRRLEVTIIQDLPTTPGDRDLGPALEHRGRLGEINHHLQKEPQETQGLRNGLKHQDLAASPPPSQ